MAGQQLSPTPLTPELLEWTQQQFPLEEVLRDLEGIGEVKLIPLEMIIDELEQVEEES